MQDNPLVLIPAFNEEKNIALVIEAAKKFLPQATILVIDDGSWDSTAEEASRAGALVLRHPFNLGAGSALQTGFKYALDRPFTNLVTMDGDGQHDPCYVKSLIAALRERKLDLSIGSRFLKEAGYHPSLIKRIGICFFSALASLFVGQRITDPTSGFRAMNRQVVEFCAQDVYPVDYPDADVLLMLHRAGFKIGEVSVKMNLPQGRSSQHGGLKPLYYVFKMLLSILVTLLRQKPKGKP